MPQSSPLYQQAADIGFVVLTNVQNGQVNGQNQKIYLQALAAAVIQLAQCINNICNNTTAFGANPAATLGSTTAVCTPTVGAVTNNLVQAPVLGFPGTFIPPNFVGPTVDPVAFNGASGLNAGVQNTSTGAISGTPTIISTQQP
jgi:hypothetical protein